MRKLIAVILIFALSGIGTFAYDLSDYETNEIFSFKSFNITSSTDKITKFSENGEAVTRWTATGNLKWNYMSIEFYCPENIYTEDDWFYFSFYYRINSQKTDESTTAYPKYFSACGYAEEDKIKTFDLARSDKEPYLKADKWQKAEYIIPMYQAKQRATVRTWLCTGIDSDTSLVYSIDFKNPKCVYIGNPHEEKDASDVEMTDVPDTPILSDGGSFHSEYGYKRWVLEGVPEVLSKKVLSGNYAFVKDSDNYWNINKRDYFKNATVFKNEKLFVLAELANKLFGTDFPCGTYVSAEEITEKNSEYDYFYDKRGFLIFSKNIDEAIDKSPAKTNDAGYGWYKSYYNVSLAMGEITWNEVELTETDWTVLREKYIEALTFKKGTESNFSSYINAKIESAVKLLELVNYNGAENLAFSDSALDKNINNTRLMAEAYALKVRMGENDDTAAKLKTASKYSLNKIFNNYVYKNAEVGSGWFENAISFPQVLVQTIAFLYDEIDAVDLNGYLNALFLRAGDTMVTTYCIPYKTQLNLAFGGDIYNPCNNYTNLLWRTLVTYQISVLAKNQSRINHCMKYLNQIFEVIEKGINDETGWINNGFYNDGSFVFHGNYPYNLGYGLKMLVGLADMEFLTRGTAIDVKKVYGYDRLYTFMEKSYLPFVYENNNLKIVQGRDTPYGQSAYSTYLIIAMMSILSGSEDYDISKIDKAIKPVTDAYDRTYRWQTDVTNLNVLRYPVLQTNTVSYIDKLKLMEESEEEEYSRIYYSMDKAVHKKKDFTFMVSMSSERIDKYTAINSDGYPDWYIADGMTYLLMNNAQYIQRWWNNVDRYEMPGTTVDSKERSFVSSTTGIMPDNSWAGGTTDGNISVCGMILPTVAAGKTSYVNGRKSYFMLEDKIICMGSGISGGEGDVYTTVENYISYDKGSDGNNGYTLTTVDGIEFPYEFDVIYDYKNPKAVTVGDRSYAFLENSDISVKRAKYKKRFAGVTTGGNSSAWQFPFITVRIEHGENPNNAKYCYAILPEADNTKAQSYCDDPDIEILKNDNSAHIIKLKDGTVMANIFESATVEGITFEAPCSVIMKPDDFGYKLRVSNPEQKLETVSVSDDKDRIFNIPVNKELGATTEFELISKYSGKLNSDGTVTVTAPNAREVVVIAAAYSDKKLSKLEYQKASLTEGKNILKGFAEFNENDNVRIFIWDDVAKISPVK